MDLTSNYIKDWRNWMKLGVGMFTTAMFTVLMGDSVPHTFLGYPTSKALKSIVQIGFYTSIIFFLISFMFLARHQSQHRT